MTAMHLGSFEAIDLALDPFRQRGLGIGHRVGDVRTYVGLGGHLFGPDHGAAGPNKLYLRWGKIVLRTAGVHGWMHVCLCLLRMIADPERPRRHCNVPSGTCDGRLSIDVWPGPGTVNKHTSQGEGPGADRDICTVRHI